MNSFEIALSSKLRSIVSKPTSTENHQLLKKVIWCGFIFEKNIFQEDFMVSLGLELMALLRCFNALEIIHTRLSASDYSVLTTFNIFYLLTYYDEE